MWRKAVSIGIVRDRSSGAVKRVFNPDYEEQLDQHHLDADEIMLRVKKSAHGISGPMSLDQLHRLLESVR
jgi:hypothetical protein